MFWQVNHATQQLHKTDSTSLEPRPHKIPRENEKHLTPHLTTQATEKTPSKHANKPDSQNRLEEYRKKRNFKVTTEPAGSNVKEPSRIFVVQEHHARNLHYDFRLENEGVLKSWAVPKGIPESPNQKRLAVQTEDHPIEYASFEGNIPEGHYGAGTVKIWDKGTYEATVWNENMLEFTLKGEKLKGRYAMVPLKKAGTKNWLLIKAKEPH